MAKEKLDAHPSGAICCCRKAEKFLFSVYDQGYPKKAYRMSANMIGGNPEPGDISPEIVLIKEISEKLDPNHASEKKFVGKVKWASEADIRLIRNGLLGGIQPMQDFFIRQPEVN